MIQAQHEEDHLPGEDRIQHLSDDQAPLTLDYEQRRYRGLSYRASRDEEERMELELLRLGWKRDRAA